MTGQHRWSGLSRPLTLAALAAVPLAVLGVFFVLPVLGMISEGFWADGHFDPGAVVEVLGRPRVHRVVWFTVWSSVAGTLLSLLLGVPAAHLLHRRSFPGRRLLRALLLVPFVLPTVVVGVAFRELIGEAGPLGFLGLDGSAAAIVACRPVPHACCRSKAGVYDDRELPSTHSRIKLKSRLCLSTAPPITAPNRSPSSPNRSTSPPSAAVNMSWLDASAYAPSERAKGMRLPPSTATRRPVFLLATFASTVSAAMNTPS